MPSPQSDALTNTFLRRQFANSAKAAVIVREAWTRTIEVDNINGSAKVWLAAVIPFILRSREESSVAAEAYYMALRALEAPDAPRFVRPKVDLIDEKFIRKSLTSQGPDDLIALRDKKLLLPDQDEVDVPQILKSRIHSKELATLLQGSAVRHVANGGRNTLDQYREKDALAVGYYRRVNADGCFFCKMLASRGVRYKEDSFDESDPRFEGEGKAKVHDWCACANIPVYSWDEPFPAGTKDYNEIWERVTEGKSGKEAILAFRRAIENRE